MVRLEVSGAMSQGQTREAARENVLDAFRTVLTPDEKVDSEWVPCGTGADWGVPTRRRSAPRIPLALLGDRHSGKHRIGAINRVRR